MSDLDDLAEISEQCAMRTPRSDGRGAKHGRVPHHVGSTSGTLSAVGRAAHCSTSRRKITVTLPAITAGEAR